MSELPLLLTRALRGSQDPRRVAPRVPEGEWGGEAEPWAAEERGGCGTVCRPLGAGELCGMEGLEGAGEDPENQQAQRKKSLGILGLSREHLRNWAVAGADGSLDAKGEEVPQGPFPSAKASSPSPSSCSLNHVFHLWPK